MDRYYRGLEALKDKPGEYLFNGFPVGLRVLVIDDDRTCLMILEKMLKRCRYQVTTCQRATEALSLLRQDKSGVDIVVSDVHMPDMDGFDLLGIIAIELDLPIVMMSSDDKQEVLLKGILHGACDYLIKPVRMDAIKVIWQHVLRKRRNNTKAITRPTSSGVGKLVLKESYSSPVYAVSKSKENVNCLKRRKDDEDTIRGKKRMVWTKDLHEKFVSAVNHLGREKAVPMKILDLMRQMNIAAGITRENIASHLQKYRLNVGQTNNIPEHAHHRFEIPRLNKKSVSDEFHSLELRHNNQLCSSSSQFVRQSFTHSQSSAPVTFTANSSIGMPLNDRTNHLLPTGLTNSNNYLAINSLANDFPLSGASGVDSSCRSVYPRSIPYSDASEYRSQGTAALHSQSLSAGDSRQIEDDVRHLLEYDPSLHFQNVDQSGVLQEPFLEESDASLAIEYNSAWQLKG